MMGEYLYRDEAMVASPGVVMGYVVDHQHGFKFFNLALQHFIDSRDFIQHRSPVRVLVWPRQLYHALWLPFGHHTSFFHIPTAKIRISEEKNK